jgi:hypothetical protein
MNAIEFFWGTHPMVERFILPEMFMFQGQNGFSPVRHSSFDSVGDAVIMHLTQIGLLL